MTQPVLAIDELQIVLSGESGERIVVDELSLKIEQGEALGLVGESGSGKSLTASSVLGMLPPQARARGSVAVCGVPAINANPAALRAIRGHAAAMVFQNPMVALNPYFTIGRQLVDIIRCRHGVGAAEARAAATIELDRVRLPNAALQLAKYPHQFSGGQLQRIMLAAALACKPQLLIADEPTTALDVTVQAEVLALLKDLRRSENLALLFISHDLGTVADLCDRIAVMEAGRIVETGPTRAVLPSPQHPKTQALVDNLPHLATAACSDTPPQAEPVEPLVRVDGACKSYAQTTGAMRALDGVSLEIARGRSLAVVGESGSGKTTLAMSILGLVGLDDGRIEVEGTSIADASRRELMAIRSRIGVVFQNPYSSLNPRFSALDIVAEPLRAHGHASRAEQKKLAGDLLERVGIEREFHGKKPNAFSGGQRQRIAIARALILQPQLVILDEPTAALDVSLQSRIIALLQELRASMGLSFLLITHNMSIVDDVADEVIVMQRGRVVERGLVNKVFTAPSEPYTRQLLDAARKISAAI